MKRIGNLVVIMLVGVLVLGAYEAPRLLPASAPGSHTSAPLLAQVNFGSVVAQGSFVRKTDGTGLQTIGGVGFKGQAAVFWFDRVSDQTTGWLNESAGIGVVGNASGLITQGAVAWSEANGASTTHSSRLMSGAAIPILNQNGLGTYDGVAQFKAWTPTGFTLNWTNNPNPAQATLISYLVVGGITNASVISANLPALCGPGVLGTGFNADPDFGLFLSTGDGSVGTISPHVLVSVGAADKAGNNVGIGIVSRNGVATTGSKSITNTSAFTFFGDPSSPAPSGGPPHYLMAATVTGWGIGEIFVNVGSPYGNNGCFGPSGSGISGTGAPFIALLLNGATAGVGSTRKPVSVGVQHIATSASTVGGLLMTTWSNRTPGNTNRGDNIGEASFGGWAKSQSSTVSQATVWASAQNATSPSNVRMQTLENNTFARMGQNTSAYRYLASALPQTGHNITLNWTLSADTATPYFGYAWFGVPPPALHRTYGPLPGVVIGEGQSFDVGTNYSDAGDLAPALVNATFSTPRGPGPTYVPVYAYPLSANNSFTNYTTGVSYHRIIATGSAGICANDTPYLVTVYASDGASVVSASPGMLTVQDVAPTVLGSPRTHVYRGAFYQYTLTVYDPGMPNCEGAAWSIAGNSTWWLHVGSANGTVWGLAPSNGSNHWYWANVSVTEVLPTPNPYPPQTDTLRYKLYVDANPVPQLTQMQLHSATALTRAGSFNITVNYSSPADAPPTGIKLNVSTFRGTPNNATMLASNGYVNYTVGRTYYAVTAPSTQCPGLAVVTAWASDGTYTAVDQQDLFTVQNTLPVLTNGGGAPRTIFAYQGVHYTFTASDIDVPACQSLTWAWEITNPNGSYPLPPPKPVWIHIGAANGTLWGTPPNVTASYAVNITLSDGFLGAPEVWYNYTLAVTQVSAHPLSRYWNVNGVYLGFGCSGFWDQQQCWSNVSGGATGATVPGPSNPVIFDANSGWHSGVGTAITANASMASLTVSSWPSPLDIGGNMLLPQTHVHIYGALIVNTAMSIRLRKSTPAATLQVDGATILNSTSSIIDYQYGNGLHLPVVNLRGPVYVSTSSYLILNGTWGFGSDLIDNSTASLFYVGANSFVTFNGSATQTIGGSGSKNQFYVVNITGGFKLVTAALTTGTLTSSVSPRTMTITAGVTWTVRAGKSIISSAVAPLSLRSSSPGTFWFLHALGPANTTVASYVHVQDSNASLGGTISALTSVSDGHNVNWWFGSSGGPGPGPGGGGGSGSNAFGLGAITGFLASTLGVIMLFVVLVTTAIGVLTFIFGRIGRSFEDARPPSGGGGLFSGLFERFRRD